MKELGFNEPCIATFDEDEDFDLQNFEQNYDTFPSHIIAVPLWQQCVDWFREKHDIDIEIHSKFGHGTGWWANLCYNPTRTEVLNIAIFDNYYEAREQAILECIELLKKYERDMIISKPLDIGNN